METRGAAEEQQRPERAEADDHDEPPAAPDDPADRAKTALRGPGRDCGECDGRPRRARPERNERNDDQRPRREAQIARRDLLRGRGDKPERRDVRGYRHDAEREGRTYAPLASRWARAVDVWAPPPQQQREAKEQRAQKEIERRVEVGRLWQLDRPPEGDDRTREEKEGQGRADGVARRSSPAVGACEEDCLLGEHHWADGGSEAERDDDGEHTKHVGGS